jgi:DNA-binding NtrC family response regulator/predicted hydrocarbon binding protein
VKAAELNLAELMNFSHGHVQLHGQRLIIHNLSALGQFRRDLIENMGPEQAQRILTRKGLFWGQADAAAMQRLFRWDNVQEWLKAGPMLAKIAGLADMELQISQFDTEAGRYEIEGIWKNSSEVEQHHGESTPSAYPICWVLVGYLTGYASFCLGKSVYFLERQCQATGSSCCQAIGKDLDSWGHEIDSYLSFFQAPDIQQKVRALTDQIQRQQQQLEQQRNSPKETVTTVGLPPVEVRSPLFQQTIELAARVARFDTTVLITGETGTGKEVLARFIHQCSPRASRPMLAVNCSALPETLLESELFGHRAGAFTGANRTQLGLFEEANGGTVFLDEIGDITPATQVKLLRVLQEREVKRVGESVARPVDVRVLSATNQNLERLVHEGRFREDLYFRLHVVQITIPPLRERREDILPLARHFLKTFARRLKLPELRLAPGCLDVLLNHFWPGNVRELENTLEHAAVMSADNLILPGQLPIVAMRGLPGKSGSPYRTLAEVELEHIRTVLKVTGGNRSEAAKILQIGEATLYRKLHLLHDL